MSTSTRVRERRPGSLMRATAVAFMAALLTTGCHEKDASEILNEAIQLPVGSYTLDDPETDATVEVSQCLDCAGGSFDLHPGVSTTVGVSFSAPSGNVIGAGIRFGDSGPIHVIPLDAAKGQTNGFMPFTFAVPQEVCEQLGSICHAVTCYEYAVTSAGAVSAANINQVAMACNDCGEATCQALLTSCDECAGGVPCSGKGDLEIVDAAGNVLPGATSPLRFVVGEKVQLEARASAGGTLFKVDWSLPKSAVPIASYVETSTDGHVVPLAASDLQKAKLPFHWTAAATGTIDVVGRVNGKNRSVSIPITVVAPEVSAFTFEVKGSVGLPMIGGKQWLRFGTNTTPGIFWSAVLDPLQGVDGLVAYRQVATPDRTRQDQNGALWRKHGANVLDDGIHPGTNLYDTPEPLVPIKPDYHNGDSPGLTLEPAALYYSVTDSFDTYLMFQSSKAGSIWVALGHFHWYWAGSAHLVSGSWELNEAKPPMTSPQPVLSPDLPTWGGNVSSLVWKAL